MCCEAPLDIWGAANWVSFDFNVSLLLLIEVTPY